VSGGAGQGFGGLGLGQSLGGIGNAFDGVFDQQLRAQANQLKWPLSPQEVLAARVPESPVQRTITFREQLQKETDEWLKGIEL
jgi:hypothetical protein